MTEIQKRQNKSNYRMMIGGQTKESRINGDGSIGSMSGIDPN